MILSFMHMETVKTKQLMTASNGFALVYLFLGTCYSYSYELRLQTYVSQID